MANIATITNNIISALSGTTSQVLLGNATLTDFKLDSLTDVSVPTPGDGDVLRWNATLSLWEASDAAGITGSGTTNYIARFTPNGGTLGNSSLYDDGTNIGFGTSTPENISSTKTLTISGGAGGGAVSFQVGSVRTGLVNGNDNYLTLQSYASRALSLGYNGTNTIVINTGNNVGIGTTSPTQKLDVSGSINIRSAAPTLFFDRSGAYTWRIVNGDGSTFPLSTFNIANNASTSIATFTAAGNVGIGTTAPTAKLEVNVGLNSLKISGRNTYVDSTEDALNANIYVTQDGVGDFGQLAGNLVLQARTQGTVYRDIIFAGGLANGDALMTILGEGNVLLGSGAVTSELLQVNGTAKITGATTVGGYTTITNAGGGSFNSQLTLVNSTSSPSLIAFNNTANGFAFGFTSTGTQRFTFINGALSEIASISLTGAATFSSSVTAASFIPSGSSIPTNGMYLPNTNRVSISTGGVERMTLATTNVGFGTASPTDTYSYSRALDIQGTTGAGIYMRDSDTPTTNFGFVGYDGTGGGLSLIVNDARNISFWTTLTERMRLTSTGNFLIGSTSDSGEKLQVTGTMKITGASSFGSTVQIAGNGIKLNFFNSGYENWYLGTKVNTTQFVIGSGTNSEILTFVNSGAATFSSSVTALGNMYVGVASGAGRFVVEDSLSSTSQFTSTSLFTISNSDQTNNNWGTIAFTDGSTQGFAGAIQTKYTDHTNNYGELHFSTRGTSGLGTRLVIDTNGAATFSSSVTAGALLKSLSSSADAYVDIDGGSSATQSALRLFSGGGLKWHLSLSNPSTYRFSIGKSTSGTAFTEYFGLDHSTGAATFSTNLVVNGTSIEQNNASGLTLNASNASGAILFRTAGSERMSIASTGALTVVGATTLSNLAGTGTRIVVTDASGNLSTQPTQTYLSSLSGEATNSGSAVTLTNSAVIGKVLTGLNVYSAAIAATDNILAAFGKIQGQIDGLQGGTIYKGSWNANTNTPAITSGTGTQGNYYVVTTAGTTTIDGVSSWAIGDWIIFNGTIWEKIPNVDAITSVNGQTGVVSLTTANISEVTNLYYTDARARAAISLTTSGSSGASTYSSGVLNIPTYTLAGLGGVATGTTITINGTAQDLSASRTFNVGTVTSIVAGTYLTGGTITGSGTIAVDATTTNTASKIVARDSSGNFSAGIVTSIGVNSGNFYDGVGSYNVNLGSGGSEGRGLVAGYSGGAYGGIGYNVRHDSTVTYIAPLSDTSSYLSFTSGGFIFYGAPSGTVGRTLSYSTLGSFSAAGTFNAVNITVNGNQTLHAANWNSYAPSLTGTGASGSWGISVTGNAGTVGGLSVHTDRNNEVNKIVRTDANGYIQAGWINTTSGDNGTTAIDRIYASSDAYLRYYTPANFRTVLDVPTRTGGSASGTWGISVTGNAATATTATNQSGGTVNATTAIITPNVTGVSTGLSVVNGDITTYRSGGTTGVIYLSSSGTKYLYWDATNYNLPGGGLAVGGNISASNFSGSSSGTNTGDQTNISGNAATATNVAYSGLTGTVPTWNQNTTGNAATATSATNALRIVFNDGPRNLSDRLPNSFTRTVNFDFTSAGAVGGTGNYAGVMSFSPWIGDTASTGDSSYQLGFMNGSGVNGAGLPGLRIRKGIDTTWGDWYTLLHAGNYNSYSPTLTGTGASGTWGISISGNAATASTSSQVTINYNNNADASYQMLWGSGNSVYGTAGITCNPFTDTVNLTGTINSAGIGVVGFGRMYGGDFWHSGTANNGTRTPTLKLGRFSDAELPAYTIYTDDTSGDILEFLSERYTADFRLTRNSDTGVRNAVRMASDNNGSFIDLYNGGGSAVNSRITTTGDSYLMGGNVGIGISSPLYKLDVSGNVRFAGELLMTDTETSVSEGSQTARFQKTYSSSSNISNLNLYSTASVVVFDLTNSTYSGNETYNATALLAQAVIIGNSGTVSSQPMRAIMTGVVGQNGSATMNIADYRHFEVKQPDRANLTGHVIQNIYGLKIAPLKAASGYNITNGWGVYQEGVSDNNHFSGKVLIGTTSVGGSPLRLSGLPTSSAGLSAGDVWNSGGTLRIV